MKSFALWCDAKNAGESTGVKVLMNFNLWAEAEKGESHTVLDVGVMLIPEEKSSKRKQICEVVKSISFLLPFSFREEKFLKIFSLKWIIRQLALSLIVLAIILRMISILLVM